jgi:uncharacterized membrane protein
LTRVFVGSAAATTAAMIAYPLAPRGGAVRRALTPVVVGGLATLTTARAAAVWGWTRATAAGALVATGTAAIERVGTATGIPFGRYRYTARLQPRLAGVPAVVPLGWWAMSVPARETATAVVGGGAARSLRIGVAAAALTAWDLFLDPQMTAEDYWRWRRRGAYRGIPASNFAGWLLTSATVMAALEALLPPRRADRLLVAQYAAIGAMETLGFAIFFGDRLVAAVGGAAMLSLAALAVARIFGG